MSGQPAGLDQAGILARLAAGQVVLLATDTLPGLHARLDRPEALSQMSMLKGREPSKPFLVLAASLTQARLLTGSLPPPAVAFLAVCWPGPFSVVLPAAGGLPGCVVAPGTDLQAAGTVAVRVPAWAALRQLLAASGPLASSSANPSGQPAAPDLDAAVRMFPSLAFWSREPEAAAGTASALVDLTGDRPCLLRCGPLPMPSPPGS